ncbi:MAG: ornithine cyclodeaminase [Clostridia bacterium]|nr:MAG: ornithine cyclodeaminase [Clostridia bacterium]
MRLRILNAQDIFLALPMPEAIEAMRIAFTELARGNTQTPQRLVIHARDGDSLFMPAFLPESNALAQKIVSVFPNNPQKGLPTINGLIIVIDADNGQPKALLEGAALTALRTGAASGLATDLLARADSHILTILGAGGQAYHQVKAVLAVRPITEVIIVSKHGQSSRTLAQRLRDEDIHARATEDIRAAVQQADILTTVTNSTTPVFLDADITPGLHINLVGAYTSNMQEAPAATIMRARVFVDDLMAAVHEAGDIIKPIRANLMSSNDLAGALGGLVTGHIEGRQSSKQITIFKSVGLAVQDVAAATKALYRAKELGLGQEIEL